MLRGRPRRCKRRLRHLRGSRPTAAARRRSVEERSVFPRRGEGSDTSSRIAQRHQHALFLGGIGSRNLCAQAGGAGALPAGALAGASYAPTQPRKNKPAVSPD